MGDLSLLCEMRGRAQPGMGCSTVSGIRICELRGGLKVGTCTSVDIDAVDLNGGSLPTIAGPVRFVTNLTEDVAHLGEPVWVNAP